MVRTGPVTNPMSSEQNDSDYRDAAGDDEPQAPAERRQFDVDAAVHGERLDKALVVHAGEFSRSHLQGLIERGCVQIDGVPAKSASQRLRAGQVVMFELQPTDESRAFTPEPMELAIVHEDAHILVVDKPAGLVVHPAPGNWRGTLLNGLLAHHAGAAALPRAGVVHRLDKDTSGLMVVAKTLPAMTALTRSIAAREVRREYLALVHGLLPVQPFSIDAPIGRDPVSRVRMAIAAGGRPARTDIQRLGGNDLYSAAACRLHTGRTHQIRVHLASRGHALVADALYGGRPALGLSRQALHAAKLGFAHPVLGGALAFESVLPPDMAAGWAQVVAD